MDTINGTKREVNMNTEHMEKYKGLNRKFGVAWDLDSPKFVKETPVSLVEKYVEDKYFNNIKLGYWDHLAISFAAYNNRSGLSLSEMVCMQKQAARDLAESIYFIVDERNITYTKVIGTVTRATIMKLEEGFSIIKGTEYFK